ncbi:hypothetical protein CPB83DRAFT_855968 [Crepidotus variabilis]|uniref:Uncharacterized protein n=1 Tax=Crepidotus variabilis TaxID=179855 RepID=A0A9P6JPD0_9AGAR|nr:hypothetical protein CPB83DRAFT_855968 [Crepidotus variabilis]
MDRLLESNSNLFALALGIVLTLYLVTCDRRPSKCVPIESQGRAFQPPSKASGQDDVKDSYSHRPPEPNLVQDFDGTDGRKSTLRN